MNGKLKGKLNYLENKMDSLNIDVPYINTLTVVIFVIITYPHTTVSYESPVPGASLMSLNMTQLTFLLYKSINKNPLYISKQHTCRFKVTKKSISRKTVNCPQAFLLLFFIISFESFQSLSCIFINFGGQFFLMFMSLLFCCHFSLKFIKMNILKGTKV